MLFALFALIIFVWILVFYLAFSYEKVDQKIKKTIDFENTIYAKELKNFEVKNEKILPITNKLWEYIIWMKNLQNLILISLLVNDHILVEWMPGLAKTRTILVMSKILWLDFKRIQFTPDMLPSDVIGWELYNKNTWKFEIFKGPIFTNLLLADEINRATPKVQSALLEAMQEHKVTIWWQTYELDKPFFVMATQNPLEQEWVFPLPEAQLDRFLLKANVDYPSFEEEKQILDAYTKSIDDISKIITKEELLAMQDEVIQMDLWEDIKNYIVWVVEKLREKNDYIEVGPSPRASISLLKVLKAIKYLKQDEITKEDVDMVLLPVLRHRIKLTLKALAEKKSVDEVIIETLLNK